MRTFVAAALLGAVSFATDVNDIESQFMNWVAKYGRSYGTREEYKFRLEMFTQKHEEMAEFMKTNPTSTVGHNQFSDYTESETQKMMGYKHELTDIFEEKTNRVRTFIPDYNADSVNWVEQGAVTPVKNQGGCGSCWAFSTTGSMEGSNQIQTGQLISLSEQQFVDCKHHGDHGCLGGLMDNAFKYAEDYAIESEEDYPYKGFRIFGGCDYDPDKAVVGVDTFYDVTPQDPDQLKAALNKQPVSVAIEADKMVFQHYTGGVITSEKCGTKLDHGVLAVGYGTEDGQEYYLVKNSWGPSWGVDGYVKIGVAQGVGICGIQTSPSAPTTKTAN